MEKDSDQSDVLKQEAAIRFPDKATSPPDRRNMFAANPLEAKTLGSG